MPYHINKNENSLKNKVYSLDFNDITKFGLNKFKSFLYFVIDTINNTKKLKLSDIKKIIKYNLLLDYIQINLNRLYMHNISILLNKINIKFLLCSHRAMSRENLIYNTCRSLNIKSIASDFSLGYPFKNIYKKEISLINRPDILIVSSLFTKEKILNRK